MGEGMGPSEGLGAGAGVGFGAGVAVGLCDPLEWCLPLPFALGAAAGFGFGAALAVGFAGAGLAGLGLGGGAVAFAGAGFGVGLEGEEEALLAEDLPAASLAASLAASFFFIALAIAFTNSSFRMLSKEAMPRFLARVANSFLVALFSESRFIIRTLRLAPKLVPTGTACIRAGALNPAKHHTWQGPHYSSALRCHLRRQFKGILNNEVNTEETYQCFQVPSR